MKSLTWKIFFGFLLVIFLFTGLILYFSFGTLKQHDFDKTIKNVANLGNLISDNIIRLFDEGNFNEIEQYIFESAKHTNSRITLINLHGKVISDSHNKSKLIENQLIQPDIAKLISHENILSKYEYFLHSDTLYVSIGLMTKNKEFYILRTAMYLNGNDNVATVIWYDILLIIGFIIVFSIVFFMFFSLRVIKPIRELSRASRKVALGDFDNKIYFSGEDELSHLARNFNQMTEKLRDYFVLAESQQEQYLTLISSLQEGLVVLDRQGKILLHNKGFEILSRTGNVNGRIFNELIPTSDFGDLVKKVTKKKKHITKEIEFHDLCFLCSANYNESKNEIVVLFHDITEIKKLENIKRDFIVNVTHELRTPLTAIKGFLETIEDDTNSAEEIQNYIQIIRRNTDRLINIVQDLLTLSQVEQKSSYIQLSQVDVKVIFDNINRIFLQKVKNKNIQLLIDIQPGLPELVLDPFRIEQVLINLIENAINYTDSGYIKLIAGRFENKVVLSVEDTGVGIPKEHHSRLFERFYTVDRSRSRKVGGTGLGLSIVKHIILLHNGEIMVDSSAGKGTKFIIQIPQKHFK